MEPTSTCTTSTCGPGRPCSAAIDLAKFDVVLLGMEGLTGLSDSDTDRLRRFTERGGRTILAANHFFVGTIAKANGLLVPYGLRMTDTEPLERPEFDLGRRRDRRTIP